jgi:hypothetical protein
VQHVPVPDAGRGERRDRLDSSAVGGCEPPAIRVSVSVAASDELDEGGEKLVDRGVRRK